MAAVEFGLMLRATNQGHTIDDLMTFNQRCIAALSDGFTTLWLEDHLQWGTTDVLECLTTVSYLAATYPQFHVGMLVLSQTYRNPALLAKMLANLQALTHGRIILGIGAGWKEDENLAYGYPFSAPRTRVAELAEAVQIIRAMWTQQPATFMGQHYRIQDAYCAPQPSPPIPLLIGAGGEQRTLAVVAQYADWWNFNSCTVEQYAHKLSVLKQHCERVGRDPATIKLTYLSTISVSDDPTQVQRHPDKHYIAGSTDEVIKELEQFRALGVTHFIFRVLDVASLEHFVARVVPKFL